MRPVVPLAACLVAAAGCGDPPIEVRTSDDSDYNRTELLEAVHRFVAAGRTPEAYGAFAREAERLRPGMDDAVADLAELELVALAAAPIEMMRDRPYGEQTDRLAPTVWPVALTPTFRARPPDGWRDPDEALAVLREGESTPAYIRRLCDGRYAVDCRQIVPEWQGPMLGTEAISRLTRRARAAIANCEECLPGEWREALSRWEVLDREAALERATIEELGDRARWPSAGPGAGPWSGGAEPTPIVTVEIVANGDWIVDGRPLDPTRRVEVLRDRRADTPATIGVHVDPGASITIVDQVLPVASAAGYRELAIQARSDVYPWTLRAYRVPVRASRPNAKELHRLGRVGDTVQIFVRSLDVHAATAPSNPTRARRR
jgi:hypothetical protein